MIDNLLRDFQVLRKADFLVARIWAEVLLRRAGLLAFASLIAVFGLGMANVAGFNALQGPLGPVWAGAIVALVDFALAGIAALIAGRARPGPELDLAFEVRKLAVDSIQADSRELKLALDALGQDMRNAKAAVTQLVRNPLDVAAQQILVPAALSIIKGMRAKK